jgi:hypothetical protein
MRNPWKLTSFVLIALLAVVLGGTSLNSAFADQQPRMQDALSQLQAAQASLEAATSDKGGHRVKALSLTRQAIREVNAGMRFDNRH